METIGIIGDYTGLINPKLYALAGLWTSLEGSNRREFEKLPDKTLPEKSRTLS